MVIALILAFLIGVFSVLLLEGIFLYKWWTSKPEDDRKLYPKRTKVTNPKVNRSCNLRFFSFVYIIFWQRNLTVFGVISLCNHDI